MIFIKYYFFDWLYSVLVRNMDHKIKIKYELVPPDGGWGYIIAFAVMLMMVRKIKFIFIL